MTMSPLSTTSRTLISRCACLASSSALPVPPVQQVRYASSAASSSKKPNIFKRIGAAANKIAINTRPPTLSMEREYKKMEIEKGEGSLFTRLEAESAQRLPEQRATGQQPGSKVWTNHKTSTGNISISPRKLNDVARLIANKPIDHAILQMQMSDKRVAKSRIKSMLVLARDHAVAKGLSRDALRVEQAWVSKGVYLKRLDIKGRGRHGVIMKPESRMHVILSPGPSREELLQQEMEKKVKQRLRTGAGFVRSDRPIINLGNLAGSGAGYAW